MSDPLVPNFKKGVGRLAADRFDFQDHIDGSRFRHHAGQIDLVPSVVIDGYTKNNVQDAIAFLSTVVSPPIILDATATVKGILKLAQDLAGAGSTAALPRVSGIQGYPVSTVPPNVNEALTWDGYTWTPKPIISPFVAADDLAGTATDQTVKGLTGAGAHPNATVTAKNDIISFVTSIATPTINQVAATSLLNGHDFKIQAQAGGSGGVDGYRGGNLILMGGLQGGASSTGTLSSVSLQTGDGIYLAESAYVNAAGSYLSHILSLVGGIELSSIGTIPNNCGDKIIFIANTATPPATTSSAIPNGTVLYSSAGQLWINQADNQQFAITPNVLPTVTATISGYAITTEVVILVNQSAPFSITLPNPAIPAAGGRRVIIKDALGQATANNISVFSFGGERIENVAGPYLMAANYETLTLVSDGAWWYKI